MRFDKFYSPRKLVLFVFAGRRQNMDVQMPYLLAVLDEYPQAELHLWDLTRDERDQRWLRQWDGQSGGQIKVISHLHTGHPIRCTNPQGRPGRRFRCSCLRHKPPYERPYQWYAMQPQIPNTVYVKIDDDVLFLETDRFDDLIAPLAENPNRIISANVVNNAVCAKYEPELVERFPFMADPRKPLGDKMWWAMHIEPKFAQTSHDWFFDEIQMPTEGYPQYIRTRPGEAVSINCVAFTHDTMRRLAAAFEHDIRLGDEGVIDQMLPWICRTFRAAHLTFGPQDQKMTAGELDKIRTRYMDLRKVYLGE
jgi:hypothetical protein